ncbi:hypothetical protein C8046_07325 [Serinibacter arcticus]|uniref:Uncharacterized protein n=1 Tax=Serinibacter arcticus TaxID=1655435 RepID=A0A2U1ZU92_9MICO|nr:hypothetical protein C8046_07325 [Serinibacter arcticus]
MQKSTERKQAHVSESTSSDAVIDEVDDTTSSDVALDAAGDSTEPTPVDADGTAVEADVDDAGAEQADEPEEVDPSRPTAATCPSSRATGTSSTPTRATRTA